jgi:hypothetical protein
METNMKQSESILPSGYRVDENGNVWSEDKTVTYTMDGQIRSYFKRGRIIKPFKSNSGYLMVSITSRHLKFYIHRLVAHHYVVGFSQEKCQVNHIDGNKTNNAISNLEWVTQSENIKHNYSGLGYVSKSCKLTKKDAINIRTIVSGGQTQKSVAQKYGVSKMVISRIINNVQKAYK